MGLESVPGQNDGISLAYQTSRFSLQAWLEAGHGPFTSGSFWNHSALSAIGPRMWAMLHAAEMRGETWCATCPG